MNTYINYFMIWLLIAFVLLVVWYVTVSPDILLYKKNKRIFFQRLIPLRLLATIWSVFKMRTLYTDPQISDINIDALVAVGQTNRVILPQKTKEDRVFSWYMDSVEPITFAQFIPLLREKYTDQDMSYMSQNRDFSYIWTWNDLFPSFSYAASKSMVWSTILPSKQVKCKHMVVMYGIAEWREVDDARSIDDYWLRASAEWILDYGCNKQNDVVVWSYLP